ncbi:MAG: lysophospholipid acyltransferase family protein [Planctomycetaceae bacterium]
MNEENSEQTSDPQAVLNCNWLWSLVRIPVWLLCRCWIRLEVTGQQNLDPTRGGLLLINHQSYLDPLLVGVFLSRPVAYLARDSLFRVPLLGWLLRNTYVIPISRESVRGGSIRTAMERVEEGFLVGIYPEGTRSSGDDVKRFRPGFLALVRRTSQPVYPVAIAGADKVFPKGAWFIRPRRIRLIYGKPLSEQDRQLLQNGSDDHALAELARERVAECHSEALDWLRTGKQPLVAAK